MEENWKNKKVLITGGAGFIGAHLTRALIVKGAHVTITSTTDHAPWRLQSVGGRFAQRVMQLEKKESIKVMLDESAPEYLFHLAAQVRGSEIQSSKYTVINFEGTKSLYESALQSSVVNFIALGSRDEYGALTGPLSEDRVGQPFDAYGESKLEMTNYLHTQLQSGISTTVLRPSSVYGPQQDRRMFIPKCICACITKTQFTTSPGEHLNNFVYVDDVVTALLRAALRHGNPEVINVGAEESFRFKDIAVKIGQLLHDTTSIVIGGRSYREGEFRDTVYTTEKACTLLNWRATTPIDIGLKKTIEWYTAHSDAFC